MTALFALEGQIFAKHSPPEAAVHRDLVKAEKWSSDLGRDFSFCVELRGVGDYGTAVRVDAKQATDAIASARRILVAVRDAPRELSTGTGRMTMPRQRIVEGAKPMTIGR